MTLLRRLRNSLQRLHWQLTISYTLVTVAALLVVESIAFGALFLFLSSDTLPQQIQRGIADTIAPQVRPYMVDQPMDRDGLQKTLVQFAADQIDLSGARGEEPNVFHELTDRELEVLRLIADGMSNADIADELVISVKTVKSHVSNILGKLHLNDRTQAAVYAWREGVVRRDES